MLVLPGLYHQPNAQCNQSANVAEITNFFKKHDTLHLLYGFRLALMRNSLAMILTNQIIFHFIFSVTGGPGLRVAHYAGAEPNPNPVVVPVFTMCSLEASQ